MSRDTLIHSLSNTVWLPLLPADYTQSCRFSCLFPESDDIKFYFFFYDISLFTHMLPFGEMSIHILVIILETPPLDCLRYPTVQFIIKWNTINYQSS